MQGTIDLSSYFRAQRHRCGHEANHPELERVGESCGGWTMDVAGGRTKTQHKVCMAQSLLVVRAQAARES